MENYEQRQFLIFSVYELNKIDFGQVLETSSETVRISLDGLKTFIKWEDIQPDFINNLKTKEGPYTYSEILEILSTEEWSKNEMI